MNKHVGVLLCLGAAVVDSLAGTAVFALPIHPRVADVPVENIALGGVELRDTVLAVGRLAAIDTPAGQQRSQLRTRNAEHLTVQDMVDAASPARGGTRRSW